jgi:hypothetical protein
VLSRPPRSCLACQVFAVAVRVRLLLCPRPASPTRRPALALPRPFRSACLPASPSPCAVRWALAVPVPLLVSRVGTGGLGLEPRTSAVRVTPCWRFGFGCLTFGETASRVPSVIATLAVTCCDGVCHIPHEGPRAWVVTNAVTYPVTNPVTNLPAVCRGLRPEWLSVVAIELATARLSATRCSVLRLGRQPRLRLIYPKWGSARPSTCAALVANSCFGRSSSRVSAWPLTLTLRPPQPATVATTSGMAVGDDENATR